MFETLTYEERKKYNSYSPQARHLAEQMGLERGWNDNQIFTQATLLNFTIGKNPIVESGGKDNPNEVWKDLLMKAKGFIENEFPRIYEQVKDAFQRAISYVKKAIDTAIDIAIDILIDIFG